MKEYLHKTRKESIESIEETISEERGEEFNIDTTVNVNIRLSSLRELDQILQELMG